MKNICFVIFISILTSCVQYKPIIPKDYVGDLAHIDDTFERKSGGSAYFYYIKSIDGNLVPNAVTASMAASYGQGFVLSALGASRDVPVKPLKIFISAKVIHSAPIASLTDSDANNHAEGQVEFLPVANMRYVIKGNLSKNYSSVWIEDTNGNAVSKRIENINANATVTPTTNTTKEPDRSKSSELTKTEIFLKISGGETLELVTEKLGTPDNIQEVKASIFAGPPAHNYTVYEYKGLGKVQFFGVQPKQLTVEKVIRNARFINEDISALKNRINTSDAVELRLQAQEYYKTETPDTEVLDIFSEKIWREKNNKNSDMIDAVSWFCKNIGKSKNSRYRLFLETVSHESTIRKIQNHAKSNLILLPVNDVEQFKPNVSP